ncbi:MAG: alpha/beta hydrolase [Ferruginibacter sp.]
MISKQSFAKYGVFLLIALFGYRPLMALDSAVVIPLWKNGAPGFENKKNEPELAKDWWVRSVHNPSLTVFLPTKEKATGAAVVICPGGGHTNLVFNAEGRDAATYFNSIGVAAFVLKYRLFREANSPYTEQNTREDIFRAMRLVRSTANQYGIDTGRIGVMGFSAGGEVSGWVAYHYTEKHYSTPDNIDLLSARPAFQILIYPGPLAVPDSVPASSPSTFLLAANDDPCCSEPLVKLLQMHRHSKVPVEMHLYAQGNHAFNMGMRSTLITLKSWPQRMAD